MSLTPEERAARKASSKVPDCQDSSSSRMVLSSANFSTYFWMNFSLGSRELTAA